jgi:hypothetical protein
LRISMCERIKLAMPLRSAFKSIVKRVALEDKFKRSGD